MKISREWLQTYFEKPLPDVNKLAQALTFHAFEIESIGRPGEEWDILDVKVTPNRGHDCLSHRGIAKELSAILEMPLKRDPLREANELTPVSATVFVSINPPAGGPALCRRYIAAHIRGIKVGPSPEWLRKSLESVGQKSINNVVDATNYVMFSVGQPLHAFDASKLTVRDSRFMIRVRPAKAGERMTALDDKEYALSPENLVIVDANADESIGIAGVKGGKASGVDEGTKDIILESANFDGVSTRRTAAALKLRTDASERFQQVLSPELAAYGARAAAELIIKLAGGELVGFADEYPMPEEKREVSVSLAHVNRVLGTSLSESDVAEVFTRLDLPFEQKGDTFTIRVPFERLDLAPPAGGPEDLAEEVGRIVGYDKIPETELSPFPKQVAVSPNFYAAEHVREELVSKGYSEVFTSVFVDKGEYAVLNKVGGEHPYLRDSLSETLTRATKKNILNAQLFGLDEVKLFEIGTVWRNGKEEILVGTAEGKIVAGLVQVDTHENPLKEYATSEVPINLSVSNTERYQPFSKYPYIVRDIAMWVSAGTSAEDVLDIIRKNAGELLIRSEKFDEFKKDDKISYAFRLVFQSFDRTLTDEDANQRMESVSAALQSKGFEIR